MYRTGQESFPELCVLAEKTDQYSVPVCVDCLPETNCSVIRLGPSEALLVSFEDPKVKILAPVKPSQMYLTPSQADRPGVVVAKARVTKRDEHDYSVEFQQDKDVQTGEWRIWNPNQTR